MKAHAGMKGHGHAAHAGMKADTDYRLRRTARETHAIDVAPRLKADGVARVIILC